MVKAEFYFGEGTLTQVQAQPVRHDTEMAYVMARPEVIFAGLALSGPSPARVALWRGSQELIEPSLDSTTAGEIGGRVSPFAPERSAFLHGFSPTAFRQPFVELPDSFDTAFFQSAPEGQRLPGLEGGDALVVENLYPGHQRLRLQLPVAQAVGHGTMADRSVPIRFVLDTLFVDAAQHRCTLLWRGRLAASNPDALAQSSAFTELSIAELGHVEGDMPAPWPRPRSGPLATLPLPPEPSASATLPPELSAASPFEGTMALGGDAIDAALASATPFAGNGVPESPPAPRVAIPGAPWAQTPKTAPVKFSPVAATLDPLAGPPAPVAATDAAEQLRDLESADAAESERARELAAAEAEKRRQAAAEEERRARELAQVEAQRAREAAEAEERRRLQAEQFQAEQLAAEAAAADREARKRAENEEALKKMRTSMYGGFKRNK